MEIDLIHWASSTHISGGSKLNVWFPGLNVPNNPHNHIARYPNMAKEIDEWPEGALLNPSVSLLRFVVVQTSYVTSSCKGVPCKGMHRAKKSGRGRPIHTFRILVRKPSNVKQVARPNIETWRRWKRLPGPPRINEKIKIVRLGITSAIIYIEQSVLLTINMKWITY